MNEAENYALIKCRCFITTAVLRHIGLSPNQAVERARNIAQAANDPETSAKDLASLVTLPTEGNTDELATLLHIIWR